MKKEADLVGIYCRVSTAEQRDTGASLERQQAILQDYARGRWPDAVQVVRSDVGTGRRVRRPGYQHLMGLARQGRLVALLAIDVSRLWRNIRDAVQESGRLHDLGVDLVLWGQGVDTSTAVGRVAFAMIAALAAFESEQTGERVKRSIGRAKYEGRKGPGRRPFGWKVDDQGKLTRDPREQEALDLVSGLRRRGETWASCADLLNHSGVDTVSGGAWSAAGIRIIFSAAMARREVEAKRSIAEPGSEKR